MRMFWRDLAAGEPEAGFASASSPVQAWEELPGRSAYAGEDGAELLRAAVSREELRSAYRMLALNTHPDRMPEARRSESEERMKRLNAAYRALLDRMDDVPRSPEQRAR